MAKLSLAANALFDAVVPVPVAGADPCLVRMTFKHRTRTALNAFIESRAGKSDAETFLDMVEGWELDAELNPAAVEQLLENYIGAGLATYQTYINELVKQKTKN